MLILSTVTPTTCKALIDAGYEVTVERSTQRIFDGESNPINTMLKPSCTIAPALH